MVREAGWIPGRRLFWAAGDPCYLRRSRGSVTVFRDELSESEGRALADIAQKAKAGVLEAWEQLKVPPPVKMGAQSKDSVDTRWVLTWKEVDGVKTVGARSAAEGYRDTDLREGDVDTAGCVSRRPPHLQLMEDSEPGHR